MMDGVRQIAIYGKGGIGKSTLTANISASLADSGQKVLQIGCDPKHDSTRLLLSGKRIQTVLDYLKSTSPADYSLDTVLEYGYGGVGCIEAGGPKPGVGCAGRGIITAFKLLDQFKLREGFDVVVYDVLGDVVCGGFAVPVRSEYADAVFLVSSGEFMALYAANNILRGIQNYDSGKPRVAGILYNERKVADEDLRVEAFAQAVGLPIIAKVPRDDVFARAERLNSTLAQMPDDASAQKIASVFEGVADLIVAGPILHDARPLSDEELERVVLGAAAGRAPAGGAHEPGTHEAGGRMEEGTAVEKDSCPDRPPSSDSEQKPRPADDLYISKNRLRSEPLYGCAFNGAATTCVHLADCAIILHGPTHCAYLSTQAISSTARRRLFERGTFLPAAMSPNIISTDMDESDMVFGGTGKLYDTVRHVMQQEGDRRPRAIIVISSCASGIIGDDIDRVRELSSADVPVLTVKADGNLSGDYMQGMLDAYISIARQAVDPSVKPKPGLVNIVFEKVVNKNTERNFRLIEGYLRRMGVSVNCRFLCNATYDSVKGFCAASLNLLAYNDYAGKMLAGFFTREYGCRFLDRQFPVGFFETASWLREVAGIFGCPDVAEQIISENRVLYDSAIAELREVLSGKRLMIITFNHDIDWILGASLDCGMEVVKICILYHSQDEGFRTAIPQAEKINREEDYDAGKRDSDIEKYKPDIVLSNYTQANQNPKVIDENIPMCPNSGFFTGLEMVRKWGQAFTMTEQGEWVDDKRLLDTVFS